MSSLAGSREKERRLLMILEKTAPMVSPDQGSKIPIMTSYLMQMAQMLLVFEMIGMEKRLGVLPLSSPKSLSPRTRQDLCFLGNTFQSLWVDFFLRGKSYLINISYNPCRKHANLFLEGLAHGIDKAVVEGKPIIMMGDYNLDYMVKSDRNCLETIFTPYDLIFATKKRANQSSKQTQPTRLFNP